MNHTVVPQTWTDPQGQVVGNCKCGNELSGSIKYGEILA